MLVKLVKQNEILTHVEIDGEKHPIRWDKDTDDNAVLAIADVSGKAYDQEKDVYKIETHRTMDVFYTDFSLNPDSSSSVTFEGLPVLESNNLDISNYKSFDLTIRSDEPHEFEFSAACGFRTVDLRFGEFSFSGEEPSIEKISDIINKNSLNSSSENHRYIYAIGTKIVQSAFRIQVVNRTSQEQEYHAELRLYR